jgi:xanthine dehydrogenase accessory factor
MIPQSFEYCRGALDIYIEPVLSKPQILIVGSSLVAQTLSRLGKAIGHRIAVAASGARQENFPDGEFCETEG